MAMGIDPKELRRWERGKAIRAESRSSAGGPASPVSSDEDSEISEAAIEDNDDSSDWEDSVDNSGPSSANERSFPSRGRRSSSRVSIDLDRPIRRQSTPTVISRASSAHSSLSEIDDWVFYLLENPATDVIAKRVEPSKVHDNKPPAALAFSIRGWQLFKEEGPETIHVRAVTTEEERWPERGRNRADAGNAVTHVAEYVPFEDEDLHCLEMTLNEANASWRRAERMIRLGWDVPRRPALDIESTLTSIFGKESWLPPPPSAVEAAPADGSTLGDKIRSSIRRTTRVQWATDLLQTNLHREVDFFAIRAVHEAPRDGVRTALFRAKRCKPKQMVNEDGAVVNCGFCLPKGTVPAGEDLELLYDPEMQKWLAVVPFKDALDGQIPYVVDAETGEATFDLVRQSMSASRVVRTRDTTERGRSRSRRQRSSSSYRSASRPSHSTALRSIGERSLSADIHPDSKIAFATIMDDLYRPLKNQATASE